MSKAIQTKFLGATDTKPSRIKASAEGVPSKTYSKEALWKPHGGSGNVPNYHIEAAKRFAVENSWSADIASGGLSDPDVWVHCFLPRTKLQQIVTGKIERGEAEPILELQRYTVIAVSSNTNSFGLKSIILLNEQGETWEILKSPYGGEPLPKQGDTIERVGGQFKIQHECPRRLKDSVPSVARKIIAEAKGN